MCEYILTGIGILNLFFTNHPAPFLIMAFMWLQLLLPKKINVEVELAFKKTSITIDNVTIEESK